MTLNQVEPELKAEQETEAKKYLQKCKEHPADGLSLRYKMEWWALENAPAIARFFGRLSLWAEERKQKKKLKK